jgi:hypothetical protein
MTTNPNESQPNPPESQGIPPTAESETAAAAESDLGAEVVIIVDHVYLPFDETGKNIRTDWAVTSVSTSRVSRGTRLKVPTDLALHLDKRKQAEILAAPLPSAAPETGKAGL